MSLSHAQACGRGRRRGRGVQLRTSAAVRGDAAGGVMQAAVGADQFIIFEVPSPPVAAPPASRKRARQAAPKIERNLDLNHSAREEGLGLLLTLAQCFSSMLFWWVLRLSAFWHNHRAFLQAVQAVPGGRLTTEAGPLQWARPRKPYALNPGAFLVLGVFSIDDFFLLSVPVRRWGVSLSKFPARVHTCKCSPGVKVLVLRTQAPRS